MGQPGAETAATTNRTCTLVGSRAICSLSGHVASFHAWWAGITTIQYRRMTGARAGYQGRDEPNAFVDAQAQAAIGRMNGHVIVPEGAALEVKLANADPAARSVQQTPSDNL